MPGLPGGLGDGGGPDGGTGLLAAAVTLDQAALRDLHNTRAVAVPAVAGKSILVNHFVFERAGGVAATDLGNSLPRLAIAIAAAAGGQMPSRGVDGVFARAIYSETVSGVITAGAYRFRIGVGNHILLPGVPLVIAMNAGAVAGAPTGSLRVIVYYTLV